jgi:hypothetical protein
MVNRVTGYARLNAQNKMFWFDNQFFARFDEGVCPESLRSVLS